MLNLRTRSSVASLSCLALLIIGLFGSVAWATQDSQGPASTTKPAKKPADPSLVQVPDVAGLPRVLIIGDSISMGYTLPVRELLKGKANVHRPPTNCGDTARGVASVDSWLGDGHWDVIHFNFGLHDLKYVDAKGTIVDVAKGKQVATTETYEKNLGDIVARLKKTGAKLIFATTTPVPDGSTGRVLGDEVKYNEVAKKVMGENGVQIDDLCAVASTDLAKFQRPKNVHFTAEGYKALAESVAKNVLELLPK